MTKVEFLDTLRRRLSGLPPSEIDELVSDYAAHFADGVAAGRSEAEIAAALGDPMRLARELRAEAGFRRWESARTPANFARARSTPSPSTGAAPRLAAPRRATRHREIAP